MATKPSPETLEDIDLLISAQLAESEELEFKQALATSDGSPDVWMSGSDRIGKTAKRVLAKEIIAFANSRGGTLVLGVGEDGEKRAATKHPIPNCRNLADRLAQSIASSVDPILSSLEAWGIEQDEEGAGYVVFRVPSSYRAPHRDRDERECYRRVSDRSEPMDMRSIQDLVLQRSSGLDSIQNLLNQRSNRMRPRSEGGTSSQPTRPLYPCMVRATAVPLEPIYIDDLAAKREFHFISPQLNAGGTTILSHSTYRWTPVLQGITASEGWELLQRTILSSGLVETLCDQNEFEVTRITPHPVGFPFELLIATVATTVLSAAAMRAKLHRSDLEFALDVEWRLPNGAKLLLPMDRHYSNRTPGPIEPTNRVSNYVLPGNESLSALMVRVERDLLSSFGLHFGQIWELDMKQALEQMLQ